MDEHAQAVPSEKSSRPAWLFALALILGVGVVGYALYSGGALQKISIPGLLDINLAPRPDVPRAVASRDFIVGKWQVDQAIGNLAGGTVLDYQRDGTVQGWGERFVNGVGRRETWSGTWSAEKVSDTEFVLDATVNGNKFHAKFRIFDHDHIQNETENYVAFRIP